VQLRGLDQPVSGLRNQRHMQVYIGFGIS